jgi:hypothetical protein
MDCAMIDNPIAPIGVEWDVATESGKLLEG